jgi:hypothetical protein
LSFVRQLQAILAVRSRYGIATAEQVDVPDVAHPAMLVMVHRLADEAQLQLTVLNFADEDIHSVVSSATLPAGAQISDMFTGSAVGTVDEHGNFPVAMTPYQGMSLLIEPAGGR